MSETVKEFQNRFDLLDKDDKLSNVGVGIKALVAAVILILDRIPKQNQLEGNTD